MRRSIVLEWVLPGPLESEGSATSTFRDLKSIIKLTWQTTERSACSATEPKYATTFEWTGGQSMQEVVHEYVYSILGVFAGFGLSGIIPAVHYIYTEGFLSAFYNASFGWLVLMGLLYILGAALYALRVPERWFPGKCDLLVRALTRAPKSDPRKFPHEPTFPSKLHFRLSSSKKF